MKYLYVLCISLQCLFAMGQVQYSKNLDFAPGNFDLLNNIVPLGDDFIVMTQGVGYAGDSINTHDGLIARINKNGDVIWKHRIYSEYKFAFIAKPGYMTLSDDTIYGVYGVVNYSGSEDKSNLFIFSIDTNGNNYYGKYLNLKTTYSVVSNILKLNDYLWLSIIAEDYQHIYLKLASSDLHLENSFIKSSLNELIGWAENCTAIHDDHFIHSFSYYDNQNYTWLKIREYDLDLNIVKEFDGLKTNEFLSDVVTVPTEDNGFMVAWNKDVSQTLYDTFPYPSAVYKLDSLFNVEWEYVFVHRGAKQFNNFRYAGDGKYLGCGASDFLSVTEYDPNPEWDYNAWAFLINEDGSLDWEKQIYDTRYTHSNVFYDGIKTDFGYAFVGKLDTIKETPSPYLNDPDGWYFTLDENGCWNGNCNEFIFIDSDSTSFTWVSIEEPISNKGLNAFPNPSNGVVTIENEDYSERRLLVYDITGNKLMDQILYAKRSIIDLSDMPSATYILSVVDSRGKIITNQKIIIQH